MTMSQTQSQDNLGSHLDELGKEIHSQKPNTRGVNMDFQKLHKFRRNYGENSAVKGTSIVKSTAKQPRLAILK